MKKILSLLIATSFLLACTSGNDKGKTTTTDSSIQNHDEHDDIESELVLNNGAKWIADSVTNQNVIDLRTIAGNFKALQSPSTGEYQILGIDLDKGLNKMIKECKMTGPAHDALHQWLKPVLVETNELKNISDTAFARKTFSEIDHHLENYYNYFE